MGSEQPFATGGSENSLLTPFSQAFYFAPYLHPAAVWEFRGRYTDLSGWSSIYRPLNRLGLRLACFAAQAAYAAADVLARRALIAGIVAADVLWGAASPIAMPTGASTLPPRQLLTVLIALIVAALTAAQWTGLPGAGRGIGCGVFMSRE